MQHMIRISDFGCLLFKLTRGQKQQLEIGDSSWELLKQPLKKRMKKGRFKVERSDVRDFFHVLMSSRPPARVEGLSCGWCNHFWYFRRGPGGMVGKI